VNLWFADPLIIEHPGGHVIPTGTAVTAPITSFLDRFCHDVGAAICAERNSIGGYKCGGRIRPLASLPRDG